MFPDGTEPAQAHHSVRGPVSPCSSPADRVPVQIGAQRCGLSVQQLGGSDGGGLSSTDDDGALAYPAIVPQRERQVAEVVAPDVADTSQVLARSSD